ncbi:MULTISPECIES: MFS transporter [Clostridium]|uniref:Alpha/beta hydrolase family protein n=1 Tax=Clostridium colicanis DSM 13634 TaxID=1121305 RepID=A0A151ARW8_9CLOT|nr:MULTISPECIES: MFS transporter [Clostridium]KYH30355.1 alpha/beta hydrolase family protein [Clostridium colicanis DSM 13634]MBE6044424.1 MFS transporter [Clostridium thermopalmarium]
MKIKSIVVCLESIYIKFVKMIKEVFGKAWIGGRFAIIGFIMILSAVIGFYLDTGFGKIIDISFCVFIGMIFVLIGKTLIKIILRVFRDFPTEFLSILILGIATLTAGISFALDFPVYLAFLWAFLIITVENFLGIGLILAFKNKGKRILAFALVSITVALNIGAIAQIRNLGNVNYELKSYILSMGSSDNRRNMPNPSEKGEYKVKILSYGSGKDKNRIEYGEEVDIKTDNVYAYPFLENYIGLKGKLRTMYWGFDDKSMPINGQVYYPEGEGKFPLVLIVHGNHDMKERSEKGYEYLGRLLASQGFITVSVDENFLNGSWFGDLGGENDARAWILLKHLDVWKKFNEDKKNPFYNKVDFNNIALIGHSRGGEAVATAAVFNKLKYYPTNASVKFNFNYNIKSIVAIAPTDEQYKPAGKPIEIKNINYLLLQGANDGDVSTFVGSNQYNRIKFDDGMYHFKSSLYIYGANHGQFNTLWGKRDIPKPLGWALNIKPLLSGEDQRNIAKTYISAFLKTTLKNEMDYISLFKNYEEGENFLPKTVYISRFEDSNFKLISNYEEDADLETSTLAGGIQRGEGIYTWKEKRLEFRSDFLGNNNAVELKWTHSGGIYVIELPKSVANNWNINSKSKLIFSAADVQKEKLEKNKLESTDFTIRLIDNSGEEASLCLSNIGRLHPPIGVKISKWNYYNKRNYGKNFEPVLQTFQIPIMDFIKVNSKFQPNRLKSIEFIFNKDSKGDILIDDIGMEI